MNIKQHLKIGMKFRVIMIILSIILGIILAFIHYSETRAILNFCGNDVLCESKWLFGVIKPLYVSLIYIVFSLLSMSFISYSFLKLWLKIMVPYFVIALALVISTPALCGEMICFDRTLVAGGFSKIFLILTILIIISKSLYLYIISRKNKKIS
jgi:hypothetical protein